MASKADFYERVFVEGMERQLCCVTHGHFRAPEGDERTDKVRF